MLSGKKVMREIHSSLRNYTVFTLRPFPVELYINFGTAKAQKCQIWTRTVRIEAENLSNQIQFQISIFVRKSGKSLKS